jgi:hypothetical protein
VNTPTHTHLQRQLARGPDDNRASPVARHELHSVQQLHRWNEEGQGLARPSARRAENVAAGQQRGDGAGLWGLVWRGGMCAAAREVSGG